MKTSTATTRLFSLETFSLVAVTTTVCSTAWIMLTTLLG